MSKNFREIKFGDLIINESNRRIPLSGKERESRKGTIPYYGAQGIIDYVDDFIFDGEYILIAEDGNNLKTLQQDVALLAKGKFWVNNHAHVVRANSNNDTRYLKYLINTIDISKYVTGSAQPKLNKRNLESIVVQIPSLEKQQKIANYLSAIDDQISINNEINRELEDMAQTLYNYWFIQFEFPNEEGNPYKSSGGDMVWNDELNQEIPSDWEVKRLGELFTFEKGRIPTEIYSTKTDKLVPYLTIDVLNHGPESYVESGIEVTDEVMMVMDGAASSTLYQGYSGIVGSTLSKLVVYDKRISNKFLYNLLKTYEDIFKLCNTGSTVPHANKNFINDFKIPLPSSDNVWRLTSRFEDIRDAIICNNNQNKELSKLRDFILPMLLNGQLNVE